VGSTIELSFAGARVAGNIERAHDPPLVGQDADRVKRDESYVKDFRPMKLGVIPLKGGRGELVLKAVKIPHSQVADLRYLELVRRAH
jgi:hypothetical protein